MRRRQFVANAAVVVPPVEIPPDPPSDADIVKYVLEAMAARGATSQTFTVSRYGVTEIPKTVCPKCLRKIPQGIGPHARACKGGDL